LFILLVGNNQLSWSEPARLPVPRVEAEIGAALYRSGQPRDAWVFVYEHLIQKSLLRREFRVPEFALSMDGWQQYEKLRHETSESRTAFMAMKFGRERSDTMFREHFIPAAKATGFDLHRIDTQPKAGLIDARMEVEIRATRFLVADLTHGNRGAYWEAGFSAGLGKPVFYTCEEGYFRRYSTHFDTNHHYIVIWNFAKPDQAVEELKAAIRATLPSEAKLHDRLASTAEPSPDR
jgi:nucleoside 2-deoxyribosyltransferase